MSIPIPQTPLSDAIRYRSSEARLASQLTELGVPRQLIIGELKRVANLAPRQAERTADNAYDRLKRAGWPGRPKGARSHDARGRFTADVPASGDAPPPNGAGERAQAWLLRPLFDPLGQAWAQLPADKRARLLTDLGKGDAEAAADALGAVLEEALGPLAETPTEGAGGLAGLVGLVGRHWRLDQLGVLFDRAQHLDFHFKLAPRTAAPVPPVPEAAAGERPIEERRLP
jgi:hypothetical protein